MLDHYIQRDIVYRLAFAEGMRFSELKPDDIENKLFTYHLKKVVTAGYAEKDLNGFYKLTPEGRRVGVGAFRTHHMATDRAYSILILAVRRKQDGAWLLAKRKTHPLISKKGFMHVVPTAELETSERAAQACEEMTGLSCEFQIRGSGFFRYYDGEELESFTHFTLLVADAAAGSLAQMNDQLEYYWDAEPDFEGDDMLPNTPLLYRMSQDSSLHFAEATYHI